MSGDSRGRGRPPLDLLRGIRIFRNALPPGLVRSLRGELKRRPRDPTGSRWHPFARSPTSAIEEAIQTLRPKTGSGRRCVGAEWWARRGPSDRGYHLHVDYDVSLKLVRGRYSFPILSSILYLGDRGGATVFCDQVFVPSRGGGSLRPRSPTRAAYVRPRRNTFVTFSPRLRHGVLPAPRSAGERFSFLVNWWHRKPRGPHCV